MAADVGKGVGSVSVCTFRFWSVSLLEGAADHGDSPEAVSLDGDEHVGTFVDPCWLAQNVVSSVQHPITSIRLTSGFKVSRGSERAVLR